MSSRTGGSSVRWAARGLAVAALMLVVIPATGAGPAENGDVDAILQELEAHALGVWDPVAVPGFAYAVVKDGETVYARGFGRLSQIASSGAVDEHTLFEIGSCTKAFNAAAVGTLVDEGKAAWGDRVRTHLPGFRMYDRWVSREFLVEDLMAQRSGMQGYALDAMSMIGFGREDIRRAVRFVEPSSSFRSTFAYQNNLHLWAADLIEEKTGLVWEEAVRRRLLQPLGMSGSTFDFAVADANPNHAMGHIPLDSGGLWTIPSDWPYRSWLSTYAPAGGLLSSVHDMAKWVAFQLGDGTVGGSRILRPETVAAIRAPRIVLPEGMSYFGGVASYAMGWVFQSSSATPFYWHTGGTTGMHSIVSIFPEGGWGLVVLTNASHNKVPEKITLKLMELCFGAEPGLCAGTGLPDFAVGRRAPRDEAARAEASIPPADLVGAYENPAYGKVVVRKEGGALTLTIGPDRHTGSLAPMGGNRYLFDWPDWPENDMLITFKADGSGAVTKVNLTGFEDVRGGDFKKVAR